MTKKYILTKDQIQSTVGTSEFPPSATAVKTVTDTLVSDVKINGTSVKTAGVANITIEDGVTSTSTTAALSANRGKLLNDRIDALSLKGRYLSLWSCVEGLPADNPPGVPGTAYVYKSGDYYIVNVVGSSNNLIPSGSTYTGAASTTVGTKTYTVGGQFYYDGTNWSYIPNAIPASVTDVKIGSTSGTSLVTNSVAILPYASSSEDGIVKKEDFYAFSEKQDALTGTPGFAVIAAGRGRPDYLEIENAATASSGNLITSGAVKAAVEERQAKLSGTDGSVVLYTATAGTLGERVIETAVSEGSTGLITSGAVYSALTSKQDTLTGTAGTVLTFTDSGYGSLAIDTTPTADSSNLITSGAVKTSVDTKLTRSEGTFTIGKDSTGYYFEE